MAQTAKDFFLRTPGTPWMSVPEEESLIIIPPKKPEFLTQASPILEPITDTMVVPPSPLANVGTAPTNGPVASANEAPIVAPQPIAMQEEPKITTGVVQMPTVQVRHVSPLTASQVMDAAMDTAGFVHAFGEPDMPGDTFLTRIRGYHKEKAEQANKDMIARAQLLNALKSSRSLSEVEKLQQKAEFLRSMGASDDEIRQSFLKGSGTTINIGEKSAQRRTQNMDDLMAKRIEEDMAQLALNDNMMALGDVVLQALESGQLSYVGKPFAEEAYKYGAKLGLLPEGTEAAVQALQTLGTNYRAATLRPTVGGGQVSNIEQQIAGVAVPGVDKTETQNKTAIRAAVGLGRALRAAHNAYVAAYYRGASEPEAAQAALQARHAYTEQLYRELGLASGRDSTAPTAKKRVAKIRHGKKVILEEGPDGNYYPVR